MASEAWRLGLGALRFKAAVEAANFLFFGDLRKIAGSLL